MSRKLLAPVFFLPAEFLAASGSFLSNACLSQPFDQWPQNRSCIAENWKMSRVYLANLTRIDIDLNDFGSGGDDFVAVAERKRLAESYTHGENQVCFKSKRVGERKSAKTQHPD